MSRYCEVRLLKSVTVENISKQNNNKKNSNIDHNTALSQKLKKSKHVNKNSHSSSDNLERISLNKNKDTSYIAEHLSIPQKKGIRNLSMLQNPVNKELDKKTLMPRQCVYKIENCKLTTSLLTRKRQSLREENSLGCQKKRAPEPVIDVASENSKETKQNKSKKKRNTHIFIWESKLTGARRVSKRLSNLRTKNKTTGKIESFNLFPLALIKKHPDKKVVPNKIKRAKRPIIKNESKKEKKKAKQILVVHNDQTEGCDRRNQKIYCKTPVYKRNGRKVKLSPEITLQNQSVQSQQQNDEAMESIETSQILHATSCINAHLDVEEIKLETVSTTCAAIPRETELNSVATVIEEINIIQNTESIKSTSEENRNKKNVTETNEALQVDCLTDSDVIIVQLEPVENVLGEWPKEKTDASSCENKQECQSNLKEDIYTNILEVTSDNCSTSTDLIIGGNDTKITE